MHPAWWICLITVGLVLAARQWRRVSWKSLLRAMQKGNTTKLPKVPHPESVALEAAYRRLQAETKAELRQLKSQENELNALLSSMTDAVVALDDSECIITINNSARKLFGVKNGKLLGRSFLDVCRHPDMRTMVRKTLDSKKPRVGEFTFPHTDGPQQLQVSGTPYKQPSKKRGAVFVLRNVTLLHETAMHRREFVANVSHELKTPITSLKGYAETLLDGALEDPETARKFTRIILRQSNILSALVEDLLQLSRIENEEEIELETVPLGPLIADALQSCLEQAEEKQTKLQYESPPDLSATCNPEMIQLVVRNLVENAIKYSPGGSEVWVRAEAIKASRRITVTDNGPGIAPEHQARLFERFYRVEKSRSKDLGGTGLGLAIVKHIAQAHGGSVSLESDEGKGSSFSIEW